MGWFVLPFFLFFGITSPQGLRLFREIQIKPPKSLQCYTSCPCPAERCFKRFLLFLKWDCHDVAGEFWRRGVLFNISPPTVRSIKTAPAALCRGAIAVPASAVWHSAIRRAFFPHFGGSPRRPTPLRRITAFIPNLRQASVGMSEEQTCADAKYIWRFYKETSLLSQSPTGLPLRFPVWDVLQRWLVKHRRVLMLDF